MRGGTADKSSRSFGFVDTFLDDIERFMAETGISASRLGQEAVNDPNLVRDLRAGRFPRPELRQRVYAYIDAIRSSQRAAQEART